MGECERDRMARVFLREGQTDGGAGVAAGSGVLKRLNQDQRSRAIPRGPRGTLYAHEHVTFATLPESERPGQRFSGIGGSGGTVGAFSRLDFRSTGGAIEDRSGPAQGYNECKRAKPSGDRQRIHRSEARRDPPEGGEGRTSPEGRTTDILLAEGHSSAACPLGHSVMNGHVGLGFFRLLPELVCRADRAACP